jgi:hypothetical protein
MLNGAGQTVGLFGADGFTQKDIDGYGTLTGQTFLPVQTVPPNTGVGEGRENTMDVEMVLSMAPAAQVVLFTGSPAQILSNLADRPDVKQFAASVTWYNGTTAQEAQMAQIAMQGTTYFQSTGDGDAYPLGSFANTVSGTLDIRQFYDITLVGGTNLSMNDAGAEYASEGAWSDWAGQGSSGGWEQAFTIPTYQYGIRGVNGASWTNRNVPDVSAQAAGTNIVINQATVWQDGGTSQATPLWGGFMALVNQQAVLDGGQPIGAANPALYSIALSSAYASTFNDVTTGCTPNGAGLQYCSGPGYDLTTGLGSPKCGLISALTTPSAVCNSSEIYYGGACMPVGTACGETSVISSLGGCVGVGSACGSSPASVVSYLGYCVPVGSGCAINGDAPGVWSSGGQCFPQNITCPPGEAVAGPVGGEYCYAVGSGSGSSSGGSKHGGVGSGGGGGGVGVGGGCPKCPKIQ